MRGACLGECLSISRTIEGTFYGDQAGTRNLVLLGTTESRLGDFAAATAQLRSALTRIRALGLTSYLPWSLCRIDCR